MYGVRGVDLRNSTPSNTKIITKHGEDGEIYSIDNDMASDDESCFSRLFNTTFRCYENDMKPSSQMAKRNWKGLLLALLVIFVISALIVLACFLTYDYKVEPNYGLPLTIADIFMLMGQINRPNAQFTNENLVYLSSNGSLVATNLKNHQKNILMSSAQMQEKQNFTGVVSISDDMRVLLLREKNPRVLARVDIGPFEAGDKQPMLNHAQFSPKSDVLQLIHFLAVQCLRFRFHSPKNCDFSKSAFVYENQIYVQRNPFNKTQLNMPIPITQDIYRKGILYGIAGFLYEEEILGASQTFWWSPEGNYLAFASIDETEVTKLKLVFYENLNTPFGPEIVEHSYPMAGEKPKPNLPVLSLYVYIMSVGELIRFARPPNIPAEVYMTFFKWIDDDRFLCGWVSRIWDMGWIAVGDVKSKSMRTPNQQSQMPIIEPGKESVLIVVPDYYFDKVYRGIARLQLLPDQHSRSVNQYEAMIQDILNHNPTPLQAEVAIVNISKNMLTQYPKWVHTPHYDVKDILYSFGNNEILYTSTGPDPTEMHLFLTRGGSHAKCLTCGDPSCRFNSAKVSKDGANILIECLGPSPPSVFLKRLKRRDVDLGSLDNITVVSNNTRLKNLIATKALPVIKFDNVTLYSGTSSEVTLRVKFMLPPELVESHITQYPVLLDTYGGPISQTVTTKYAADWPTYLATQFKFVVISIDGRGTGNRGKRFESAIHKNLGVVEVQDQMNGLREILKTHKYLNKSRVCAFGWSYGGFTVVNMLGHPDNDFLFCGVAVAPVTDFRLYGNPVLTPFVVFS
ncbi:hypothetical protein ACTXT7_010504 [Hymenolepis weldensis]